MPRESINSFLETWIADGKPLGRREIFYVLFSLRKRRVFNKALQVLDWVKANNHMDFEELDYASYLDLIAKVYGLRRAESYINQIPEAFRGALMYQNLLANYTAAGNIKKAEETFNKIRDLGFSLSRFACNQLLLIYKRLERNKMDSVLAIMESENIKPSLYTYSLFIDAKGCAKDVSGMEEMVEKMKAEGVEPGVMIYATIAKHYILGGLNEKAEAIFKEMEGGDINENRNACKCLLPLYAELGKVDDVERIWEVCKAKPRIEECLAAIEAWGKLGQIENAEKIFEHMSESYEKLSFKYYDTLLKVYAKHKLVSKGKDLVIRMSQNGCRIGPVTWDALVNLFVEAGEVEKADLILQNAEEGKIRPFYSSYMTLLDGYAKRGNVQNAEKVFQRLRQARYTVRMMQYELLAEAYKTAKIPAYGFKERMSADNLAPNSVIATKLPYLGSGRTQFLELLS